MSPEAASPPTVRLSFEGGTLLLEELAGASSVDPPPGFEPDPRAGGRLRAPAIAYRRALGALIRAGHRVDDRARAYRELDLAPRREREPFPHQSEALDAWWRGGKRGVVVLPTGSGKTYVAEMAMARVGRSTLVVAPTLDLMNQWMLLLAGAFGDELVGGVGGGLYELRDLTVTTYDSAYLHMERFGDRFGLLVFDEAHHLPGPSYAQAAECAIAPFRLGLTATPERPDGAESLLDTLVGPTVYRRDIQDLRGQYLADYETIRLRVALDPAERAAYEAARAEYLAFVRGRGISVGGRGGWSNFILHSSQSRAGRRAWQAWREQKRIAHRPAAKLALLADLLHQHRADQTIVFTHDNDTVYAISRQHLVPAITHQTPTAERQDILKGFNEGRFPVVVTSRVLNEGVDMPAARVGVVLSGSGSVREHVQRLGRILRRQEGKEAILYEVVTADTAEEGTSERRREHGAYE